ncbi:Cysteine desulfurase IscS 2 [uncultured archaeon]|nr:Cysteine desulfurase IscS 2 [uncultured archaeon]
MLPFFTEQFGNPSSLHSFGRQAKEAVNNARSEIASSIGAKPDEIVFTSGGTESNNFALKGVAFANRSKGRHIIVSSIEHDCIMNSAGWLASEGFEVTYLPVDKCGIVDPADLESAIRKDTTVVSVMHANNEIGTIEPIAELGRICGERGVYFHSDACQSFGKVPVDVNKQNLNLLTINAHKIYGPKGVGALYIREGTKISPWQHGGGHEFGLRSSTENVTGIVGFAKAVELCRKEFDTEVPRLTGMRDRIIDSTLAETPVAYLNGHRTLRTPNNVNLGFHGYEGESIKIMLDLDDAGIAVSTGSACSSNHAQSTPSHVLKAIGLNPIEMRGSLRVSLGRFNTKEEVDIFLETLPKVLGSLKSISSIR